MNKYIIIMKERDVKTTKPTNKKYGIFTSFLLKKCKY